MGFIESILNSRAGNYAIMITILILFIVFLRLTYGPKGFLRKNLWNGIEDDEDNNENKNNMEKIDTLDKNNDSNNAKKNS